MRDHRNMLGFHFLYLEIAFCCAYALIVFEQCSSTLLTKFSSWTSHDSIIGEQCDIHSSWPKNSMEGGQRKYLCSRFATTNNNRIFQQNTPSQWNWRFPLIWPPCDMMFFVYLSSVKPHIHPGPLRVHYLHSFDWSEKMSNLQNNEAEQQLRLGASEHARLLIVFALVDRVFFSNYVQSGMIIRCCLTIIIIPEFFCCDPQILLGQCMYIVCDVCCSASAVECASHDYCVSLLSDS